MIKLKLQLFAKTLDLSDILNEVKSTIVIGERTMEINNKFSDVLKMDKLVNSDKTKDGEEMSNLDFIRVFLEIALGKSNSDYLFELDLPLKHYKRIIDYVKEVVAGESDDTKSNERPNLV